MDDEVTKEVNTLTPASAEPKREICLVDSTEIIIDGNSVPSYLRRKQKPVPHYLRASTGSCHDNCKFGTHHSSESKKDCPVRGWREDRANAKHGKQDKAAVIPRGSKAGNKDPAPPKISSHVKPEFTKQKPAVKVVPDHSKSSQCLELRDEVHERKCLIMSFDGQSNCGDGEFSEGAVSIDLEMPLAIQDHDEPEDHIMDAILPLEDVSEAVEQSLMDHVSGRSTIQRVSSEKRNDQTVMAQEKHRQNKHGTKSESLSREPVKPKIKETSTVTRNTVSSHGTGVKSQRKAAGISVEISNRPRTTAKKADVSAISKFNGEKKFPLIVASTSLKLKEIKVPSPARVTDSSAESTRLSKPNVSKYPLAPSAPSGKQTGRKMTLENVARKGSLLGKKMGEEKVTILSPLKLSRSINMSAKSLSSPKMRVAKKKTSSPVKRKKVYGTELLSDCKGNIVKTASPKIRKPDVSNKERQSHKEKAVVARTESVGRPNSVYISSSTVTRSPRKLTFRRGKVLTNLASNSNSNTPRRVQFRPGKDTDDSNIIKGPTRGRITRKSGTGASDISKDSGASQAEVVVLRHQAANEKKKSEQQSFNKVIKKMASRLAEARKSKVKALVGAFETVISLQEKRGRSSSVSIS